MDKETEMKFNKAWEAATKNAKIIAGPPPKAKSSLSEVIKTKEQAERFMRDLKICFGELIIVEAPRKSD